MVILCLEILLAPPKLDHSGYCLRGYTSYLRRAESLTERWFSDIYPIICPFGHTSVRAIVAFEQNDLRANGIRQMSFGQDIYKPVQTKLIKTIEINAEHDNNTNHRPDFFLNVKPNQSGASGNQIKAEKKRIP